MESVSVADASKFLAPLTVAVPVLIALWETLAISESVLSTATGVGWLGGASASIAGERDEGEVSAWCKCGGSRTR